MMKLISFMTLLGLLFSCKAPPDGENFVPVVGLNALGKSEVKYVPTKAFQSQMSPFMDKMSAAVTAKLNHHEDLENVPWDLSRVTVGLALEAEVEVFELAEVEGHGDIELRFQKTH